MTFCEDCGARLKGRASTATPPAGIRVEGGSGAPRPAAPDLSFARGETAREPTSSRPSAPRPSAPDLLAGTGADVSPLAAAVPAPRIPTPEAAEARIVVCPRCRGLCEKDTTVCRSCGAPLPGRPSSAAHRAAAPVVATLVSVGPDGSSNATFDLATRLDVGRTEGDVVITWDPYLSPRHMRLEVQGGKVLARDLGSVNGVFVRLPAAAAGSDGAVPLEDQDLILLGQQVIRFEVVRDTEAGLGPATQHGTALFGTPAGRVYARLCQRTVEGITRDVFHVRKDEVTLGRETADVVFTDDAFLSRRHAMVRRSADGGSFQLLDAGSSNGTFLRARRPVELAFGDELRLGQQLFRLEPPSSPKVL